VLVYSFDPVTIENPTVKDSRWIESGLVALALLLGCHAAHAFNMRWLEYSPVQYFTDEDWRLLKQTVHEALRESRRGDKLTWNNPDSGNSGSVTNLGSSGTEGRECTRLGIHNTTGKLSGTSVASFCKQGDGSWKMEGK
jgi:hypothetical protein